MEQSRRVWTSGDPCTEASDALLWLPIIYIGSIGTKIKPSRQISVILIPCSRLRTAASVV